MRFVDQKLEMRERIELFFLSLAVSLVLAAGSVTLGVVADAAHGKTKIAVTTGFVAVNLLIVLSSWLRQSRTGGYKRVAARLARAVSGAGLPVVIALGDVCQASQAEISTASTRLTERVLETARRMCGVKNSNDNRSSFYRLTPNGTLKLYSSLGRTPPKAIFSASDIPDGRAVVEFSQGNSRVDRKRDVTRDSAPLGPFDNDRRTYRSYIASPVRVGSRSYGLLVIDSPQAGAFTKTDEGTLMLLAGALGAGLARGDQCV